MPYFLVLVIVYFLLCSISAIIYYPFIKKFFNNLTIQIVNSYRCKHFFQLSIEPNQKIKQHDLVNNKHSFDNDYYFFLRPCRLLLYHFGYSFILSVLLILTFKSPLPIILLFFHFIFHLLFYKNRNKPILYELNFGRIPKSLAVWYLSLASRSKTVKEGKVVIKQIEGKRMIAEKVSWDYNPQWMFLRAALIDLFNADHEKSTSKGTWHNMYVWVKFFYFPAWISFILYILIPLIIMLIFGFVDPQETNKANDNVFNSHLFITCILAWLIISTWLIVKIDRYVHNIVKNNPFKDKQISTAIPKKFIDYVRLWQVDRFFYQPSTNKVLGVIYGAITIICLMIVDILTY